MSGSRGGARVADRVRARRWKGHGWQSSGTVTLLSDFGGSDPYAGVMRGVVLRFAPDSRLVDLTHAVPPQSIEVGALLLRSAVSYFADGSVHLAVVDPGVGGARAGIVVVTDRALLVGPDNGLLHPSAVSLGLREVRRIENEELLLNPISATFHGRDVFAPIAGRLAAGMAPQSVGPEAPAMERLQGIDPSVDGDEIVGKVIHVDHFGNLISNIAMEMVAGADVSVRVGDHVVEGLSKTYGDVAKMEMAVVGNSWGTLEIAQNGGNAALALAVDRDAVVRVARRESHAF